MYATINLFLLLIQTFMVISQFWNSVVSLIYKLHTRKCSIQSWQQYDIINWWPLGMLILELG